MEKKFFAMVFAIFAVSLLLVGCVKPPPQLPNLPGGANNTTTLLKDSDNLKSFSSWNEVKAFLQSSNSGYGGYGGYYTNGMMRGLAMPLATVSSGMAKDTAGIRAPPSPSASDYSQTNVQVAGVDEADMVKNDGKYIYKVDQASSYYGNGNSKGKVIIVQAYPATDMRIVSQIEFEGTASDIFVYKDKLVVFGSVYRDENEQPPVPPEAQGGQADVVQGAKKVAQMIICRDCHGRYGSNFAFMKIYDISDRAKPKLAKQIESRGNYVDSRMIGGKVYAIFQDYARYDYPMPLISVDGKAQQIAPTDVKYFDSPDANYNYDSFVGIDLNDLSKEITKKIILMGYSQNLFVSQDNMYISYTSYSSYYPQWKAYDDTYGVFFPEETKQKVREIDSSNVSDWQKDRLKVTEANAFLSQYVYNESRTGDNLVSSAAKELLSIQLSNKLQSAQQQYVRQSEKTIVNKISLANFAYIGKGEVPGHVLNQFSMDESNGYFRIATTLGQVSGGWGRMMPANGGQTAATNNVYVLDSNMNTVGKLEGLAPGEKIYSARFMGNRAYLVTFKKVDPLFVIDLSSPTAPKVLGKLKIPGYSDYLHPYDENYIIGLGKGAVAAEEGDFAWYQGVKLSLFDVRDVANPKEAAKFEIGDRGTDSYALSDHKAFLFSKNKGLLVIPITLAEINKEQYVGREMPANTYGIPTFQGAYVFSISPEQGFVLRGRISHSFDDSLEKSGLYYWTATNVKRSLYMDNNLYTVSDQSIKANDLGTLVPISSVQISNATNGYGPVY